MSRKFKRFLSIMMVAAMVIAMAAACGKKEEAADPEKKEDTKVEAEKETEPTEDEQVDNQQVDENSEATDSELSLEASIANSVVNEYLKPNGIAVESFSWPSSDSAAWDYFYEILLAYKTNIFSGSNLEVTSEIPLSDSEKQLMDAAFNGVVKWNESLTEKNLKTYSEELSKLHPYETVFPTIDLNGF